MVRSYCSHKTTMEALIILAFVLTAGVFFVILSRLQRGGDKHKHEHKHDESCGHDHSKCGHDHHDSNNGGCCGGHH